MELMVTFEVRVEVREVRIFLIVMLVSVVYSAGNNGSDGVLG